MWLAKDEEGKVKHVSLITARCNLHGAACGRMHPPPLYFPPIIMGGFFMNGG